MKRLLILLAVALLAGCNSTTDNAPAPAQSATPSISATPSAAPASAPNDAKWTVTEGIETPESIYIDAGSGDIFSSQIAGMADQKDGNGHIVKLDKDGKVVSSTWVTGLNAPKGLRADKGVLWTADIDEVVGIDMASAKVTSRVKVPGAQFLNDVACGPDGTVYVSDTLASKIYAVKGGKVTTFAEGPDMEYPNGLLVENGNLVVGGWGKPEADFSTKVPGRLFTVDLKTKKKTLITPEPFANIDGLESDGKGGYLITDFNAGKLIHVSAKGEISPIRQFMPGTADIAFDAARNLVLIPHMNENKLDAYDISQ